MARTARRALIVLAVGLALGGCGKKGPLDPPGGVPAPAPASTQPETPPPEGKKDPNAPERVLETPRNP